MREDFKNERANSHLFKKDPVAMTVRSRVPSKWRFVDLETGDAWRWDDKCQDFVVATDLRVSIASVSPQQGPIGVAYVVPEQPHGQATSEPPDYVRALARNQDGKPVLSAATSPSLYVKMTELMNRLRRDGFLGLRWPEIRPECVDEWTGDYAIVCAAYPDDDHLDEFYDRDAYYVRFERFLRAFFCSGPGNGVVTVNFRPRTQEIEVFRPA